MIRWIVKSQAFDTRYVAASVKQIGPQGLEYDGASYTLFGLVSRCRVLAVPDYSAVPVVLSFSYEARDPNPVCLTSRLVQDRLDPAYASTIDELIQRLAVQMDQTRHAFESALAAWLNTGLLTLGGLPTRLSQLYYMLPSGQLDRELLNDILGFQRADSDDELNDTPALRRTLLRAIEQIVRFKVELVGHDADALSTQ
jgi:hypothetical protein